MDPRPGAKRPARKKPSYRVFVPNAKLDSSQVVNLSKVPAGARPARAHASVPGKVRRLPRYRRLAK